ncbi:hypothetical protein [Halorussus litoreus]|uniref:hypothetical protein n=1 Tax=Halorussus litoreus TaxID=1710536 RepID=UPI00130041B5|nr:hypothetical protein [Halorussus litoreus]
MSRPPLDPQDRIALRNPTWRNVLVSYAMVLAVPIALWAVSEPLAGAVVVATLAGLAVATRRAYGLVRCFRQCRGFAFDLGETARITVTQTSSDEVNAANCCA